MAIALTCPTCGLVLFAAPTRAGVHACGACGGIWADNETTQLIAAVLDPELVDLGDRAERNRAGARPLPADAPGSRACADCRAPLVRVNIASTNLDICNLHGTWFDRGELQRVSKKLDADRDLQIPRTDQGRAEWVTGTTGLNGGGTSTWNEDGPSAQDVATDIAVSLTFGLLEGIVRAALGSSDDD